MRIALIEFRVSEEKVKRIIPFYKGRLYNFSLAVYHPELKWYENIIANIWPLGALHYNNGEVEK